MPQARIPNASFIAGAELPILPFLAPRAFVESFLPSQSHEHHGRLCRTQKEKETADKEGHRLRSSSAGFAFKGTAGNLATPAQSPLIPKDTTRGRLLRTVRPPWISSRSAHIPESVRLSYADIFTFGHQHLRSYSTTRPIARGVKSRQKRGPEHSRAAVPARQPSVLNQRGHKLASRREKALALERGRLANYMNYLPSENSARLIEDGRYRSLHRRIANLRNWNLTNLDLRQKRHDLTRHSVLIKGFAALDRSIYPAIRRHTCRIAVHHDPRCFRWSRELFKDSAKHELHKTWKTWMTFDIGTRKVASRCLLLYLLDRKPSRAMQFIQVLANDPILRGGKTEAIADALGHLSKIHKRGAYWINEGWSANKEAVRRSFVPAFFHIFRKALVGQRDVCSQDLLYNIVDLAEKDDLKKVFDCLMENRTYLAFDTILHYANAFAQAGDIPSALQCLDELKAMSNSIAWEAKSGWERLRWTCALILRRSMTENHDYHETPGIVATFVRLGIKMDILLYNIVMHNAMEALDYATAFKVYNALEGNGLEADAHTYSILLHGCTSQSNPAMFSHFAQHCADVAETTQDRWLATDYIYYLYVRNQNDTDKSQTLALLEHAYMRFFSTRPLERIDNRIKTSADNTSDKESSSANATKFEATPVALYIMLQARIQAALVISSQRVLGLYTTFKSLVRQGGDEAVTKLAKHPTIWNAFLLAFCREQQFSSASQLIKDMTDGSPQPNIYSWNTFMQGFFKTGQVQAAERVFQLLRNRGIDPDQYTYGVLLRGYAKAQHIERIGDIMEHVNSEQETDPDLLKSLARITNRNTLMLTLEKSRIQREIKTEKEAQIKADEEKMRWTAPWITLNESEAPTLSILSSGCVEDINEEDQKPPAESKIQALNSLSKLLELNASTQLHSPQQIQENLFDPELQYRKPQEQLDALTPASSALRSDGALSSHSKPVNPVGANPSFKSMLANNVVKPQVFKELPKFRVRRVWCRKR
ncbi:hypothetical protein GQ44DRAFT_768651 [Phaeosphaeriaceae sp. PMI808]|nr:hypothetical protein GQ44DRAFT_768651 [Phaeosphaeriaceae sp. PMI808]